MLTESSRIFIVGLIVVVTLSGCADAVHDAETQQAPQPAPQDNPTQANFSVAPDEQGQLCAGGKVTATLRIDGGAPVEVPVDCAANLVSGALGDVPVGAHTFDIEFSRDGVLISRITAAADFISGASMSLTFGPPRYIDSDGDGFTNLSELVTFGLYSLAWNDPNVRPAAETPRFSANYVVTDQVGKAFVAGRSGSANYQLRPGF